MKNNSFGIPTAIVVAGAFIALAVYFTGQNDSKYVPQQPESTKAPGGSAEIPPVNKTDHIRGNPNAPIVIIEYLDYNCPHCMTFHFTMNKIMDKYGFDGEVAWVYRHLPVKDRYPNSFKLALAAECVADLSGNRAFWIFSDLLFSDRKPNELADATRLDEFAKAADVDINKFNRCLSSGVFNDKIETQLNTAIANGAKGTPYIILVAGGQTKAVEGSISYQTMVGIIEELLK